MHQLRFQLRFRPRPSSWILAGPTSKGREARGKREGAGWEGRGEKGRDGKGRDKREGKENEPPQLNFLVMPLSNGTI